MKKHPAIKTCSKCGFVGPRNLFMRDRNRCHACEKIRKAAYNNTSWQFKVKYQRGDGFARLTDEQIEVMGRLIAAEAPDLNQTANAFIVSNLQIGTNQVKEPRYGI